MRCGSVLASVSLLNPYDAIADLGTILKLESSNLVALQMRGEVLYSVGILYYVLRLRHQVH